MSNRETDQEERDRKDQEIVENHKNRQIRQGTISLEEERTPELEPVSKSRSRTRSKSK